MKQFLEVGKVVNTHGVRGEMKMQLWCDGVDFLKPLKNLYENEDGSVCRKIISVRQHKDCALLVLDGIDSIEKAQSMKNKVLYCSRSEARLPEGKNFIQDLIGCYVVNSKTGDEYGEIKDVLNHGSCDIYDVESWGKHTLIPAIPEIIDEINIEYRVVKITPMKGLFDED